MPEKGYLQVYTGNGKGKTTASLGVCLRALNAGMNIFFAQFIKKGDSGEFAILKNFANQFTHKAYGSGRFIMKENKPAPKEIELASNGLKECAEAISSGKYDLVVLDEANSAVKAGLFTVDELLNAINGRRPHTEIIVTGRDAAPKLIDEADLVTEMREVKHYWKQGVTARKGIEL